MNIRRAKFFIFSKSIKCYYDKIKEQFKWFFDKVVNNTFILIQNINILITIYVVSCISIIFC